MCSVSDCEKEAKAPRGMCWAHYQRLRRYGDTGVVLKPRRASNCSVEGCQRRHDSHGLCAVHRLRQQRRGDLGPATGNLSGPDHGHWQADSITYASAHSRVKKKYGLATEWSCAHCACPAEHWAYNHEAVTELLSPEGWPYSPDPDDYFPLCGLCHKAFDGAADRRRRVNA